MLGLLMLVILPVVAPGAESIQLTGYGRSRSRHNYAARSRQAQAAILESQLQAANDFLAAAKANVKDGKAKLDSAKSALAQTRSQLDQDKHEHSTLAAALRRLEESLLAEHQDTDTPYGHAYDANKDAREEVERLEKEAGSSTAYVARAKQITGSKAPALLLDLKRELLKDDADYQVARDELKLAQEDLAKQREVVLKENGEWVTLYDTLRTTERDIEKLEARARSEGIHKLPAANQIHASGQTVAAAEAMVGAIQNRLNQMGVKTHR
jgi:chromosome segregation ATPase